MQINNVALRAEKCKPHRLTGFERSINFTSNKVRYKHYEEINDDVLKARSIIKAHQDVQNGNKMRIYKALPGIATGIVTTSIAIARPGKLSQKLVTGLGFLAALTGLNAINDIAFSKDNEDKKNGLATLGALTLAGAGIGAVAKNSGKSTKTITKFLTKEAKQLAREIDKTKLAKYSNKYIEPFIKEHTKLNSAAPFITIAATGVLNAFASLGLLKGMSKDIKEMACKNYEKGKLIQQIARNHYNSIDAIEV